MTFDRYSNSIRSNREKISTKHFDVAIDILWYADRQAFQIAHAVGFE
jgi:hypothetical protein